MKNNNIYYLILLFFILIFLGAVSKTSKVIDYEIFAPQFYLTIVLDISIIVLSLTLLITKNNQALTSISFDVYDLTLLLYIVYLLLIYAIKSEVPSNNLQLSILGLFTSYLIKAAKPIENQLIIYWFIVIFTGFAFFNSLLGICQYFDITEANNDNFNITGTFFNPGPLGIFLVLSVPLILYLILVQQRNLGKLFCVIILIFILTVIVLSQSRTAWVSLIVCFTYLYLHKIKMICKFFKVKSVIICLTTVSILFIFYKYKENSALGRLMIWKISLGMFIDHPFFGIGIDGYERSIGQYIMNFFTIHSDDNFEKQLSDKINYAYNDYIQILIEKGLLGLSFFLALITPIFKHGNISGIQRHCTAAFIALLISCFFSYPLEVPIIYISFCILLGICVSNKTQPFIIKFKNYFAYIPLGLIFLCSMGILQELTLLQAKVLSFNATKLLNDGKIEQSIELFQKADPILANDYTMLLPFAKALSINKQYYLSNQVLINAEKITWDPFLYINKGDNFKMMGNLVLAEKNYVTATKIDPKLIYPKYVLAKFYLSTQNTWKAKVIANEILNSKVKVTSDATEQIKTEMFYIYLTK